MTDRADREHVLIAVPTLNKTLSAAIANLFSMASQRNFIEGHPYKYTTMTVEGIRGISLARNNIAQAFRSGPFDRLWMIDDDISPRHDSFALLDEDADIIAPMMPLFGMHRDFKADTLKFQLSWAAVKFRDLEDLNTSYRPEVPENSGVVEMDAVGFGCTIIRGKVLRDERLKLPLEFVRPDGRTAAIEPYDPPPIFRSLYAPNGALASGEDIDFCWRAKKLGYSVKLHTDIYVGHSKTIDLLDLFMIQRHMQQCSTSVAPVMA